MKSTLILAGSFRSAAPVENPTGTPVPAQSQEMNTLSGGAIAGIVLGCLAILALASLLAWCWRRNRSQHATSHNIHSTYENQNRDPVRTVVTEKIEPVVVKSGTHQTYNNNTPANNSTIYTTNTRSVPANQGYNTSTTYNTGSNTVHPSTSYNTTTRTGYNTASNGYNNASNTYNTGYNTTNDVRNNARGSH